MDRRNLTLILLFLIIYFGVYFKLTYFVFFNYDMPRLANVVQEFLLNGTFLTSQYFMEPSCWLNVPWGPFLIFFYAFFLKFSSDPLIVSHLLSLANLVGIAAVFIIMWKHFSKIAAFIAIFLLALNPYWVTYSRIIYQPSPITIFLPISMYLLFAYIKKENFWVQVLLPISWTILIQIYLPTYSYIFTCLVIFLINYKKINIKAVTIGLILSAILFIPSLKFYRENPIYVTRFIQAPQRFTPPEKSFKERLEKVFDSYIQIPVGGKFEWQTSYALDDFQKMYFPKYKLFSILFSVIFTTSIVWNLVRGFVKKKYTRVYLVLLAITPMWSLLLLWVTDLAPRYFLISIAPSMMLIGIFFSDMIKMIKWSLLIPLFLLICWLIFDVSYNEFIKNYNFPKGRFGDVSETPYIFLKSAIGWVIEDSSSKGCKQMTITNNESDPNFSVWLETRYIWKYVYKIADPSLCEENCCYYEINYRTKPPELNINDYKFLGPYSVFEYNPKNLPNRTN